MAPNKMVVDHQIIVENPKNGTKPDGRRPSNYCGIKKNHKKAFYNAFKNNVLQIKLKK